MPILDYMSSQTGRRPSGYTLIGLISAACGIPWTIFLLWYLVPHGAMRLQNAPVEAVAEVLMLIPFITGTVYGFSACLRGESQQRWRVLATFSFYLNLILLVFLFCMPAHALRQMVIGFMPGI